MANFGKMIVAFGGIALILGLIIWGLGVIFPDLKPGRLPGDIAIERDGFRMYIPITSMIVLSLFLTGVIWLVGLIRR